MLGWFWSIDYKCYFFFILKIYIYYELFSIIIILAKNNIYMRLLFLVLGLFFWGEIHAQIGLDKLKDAADKAQDIIN